MKVSKSLSNALWTIQTFEKGPYACKKAFKACHRTLLKTTFQAFEGCLGSSKNIKASEPSKPFKDPLGLPVLRCSPLVPWTSLRFPGASNWLSLLAGDSMNKKP